MLFLTLIGFFLLALVMDILRYQIFSGLAGGGFSLGIAVGPWQILTSASIVFFAVALAYGFAPHLLHHTNQKNKYISGIIFTFLCWMIPLTFAQLMDGMNSPSELLRSVLTAAMAGLLIGPVLGLKMLSIKSD